MGKDNNTSPLTNLDLAHRQILRLSTVRDIMLHFLAKCQEKQRTQWAWQEDQARAHCQAEDTDNQLFDRLKELDSYVTDCRMGLRQWQQHVDAMETAADTLRARLQKRSASLLGGACKTHLAQTQLETLRGAAQCVRSMSRTFQARR